MSDVSALLFGPPYLDDDAVSVFDEIELERTSDVAREVDLGSAD